MTLELGKHQIDAVRELKNGSVLKGGVGTGKSRTGLFYYWTRVAKGSVSVNGKGEWKPAQTPRDLYIITTAKKRDSLDWAAELPPFGLSADGSSVKQDIKVTVDSWNNIAAYSDVKGAFFIFDEQRLVGSGAWVKAFITIAKSNEWIVCSATPGDVWMDYVPIFIANGFYKNRTEFIRKHVVYKQKVTFPAIDRYVDVAELEKYRRQILVEMPYARHTIRHIQNIIVDYDQDLYKRVTKDRWHIYEDRPIKQVSELFSVMRKVVNSDVSRYGETLKLFEKHPKLIIFYNFDYELATLRVLCSSLGVPYAEWNGHKHQEIPETDTWIYLVQYIAGAEGWNCIATNATLFWSLNYSYKVMEQSEGRTDRLNTLFTDLYYYRFRSNSSIDNAISKAIAQKKVFNERDSLTSL